MMQKFWVVVVLGSSALAQTGLPTAMPNPPGGAQGQAGLMRAQVPDDSGSAVPMDAPVLTIKGFCPDAKTSAAKPADQKSCETVITRAQFEQIAQGVAPTMNKAVKQQLAGVYPKLLVMAHDAEAEGLDKQPQVIEQMAIARLRILSEALTREMQHESAKVTEQEISDYYRDHPEVSEEYTLKRLFIPLRKTQNSEGAQLTPEQRAAQDRASEEEMTKLAQSLRARAAAGEDLLKLQKEALAASGDEVNDPNVNMGAVRRTALPATHTVIFEMKPGDVSPVVTDSGGHYVYYLDTKDKLDLGQVHTEIRIMLGSQHMRDATAKIENSITTEKNEAYFGAATAAKKSEPEPPK